MKAKGKIGNIYSLIACWVMFCATYIISNDNSNATLVSILLLVFSGINVYFCKSNKMLLVLFSIIFYVNLSVSFPGFIWKGRTIARYQYELWNSQYATIYAKCLMIVSGIFSVVMRDASKKDNSTVETKKEFFDKFDNELLSIIALGILVFIFIFCFDGSSVLTGGTYASNGNALYEYAVFFFALSWLYGASKKYIRIIWYLLAAYYVIIGIVTGDRSSCFMLIVMIVLYAWKKASFTKMMIYAILGIVFANAVAVFRKSASFIRLDNLVSIMIESGSETLFSDTAYYSCYSGLTISYYRDAFTGDKIVLFIKWIINIFTGNIFIKTHDFELVAAARSYYINGGGGIFPAYFYFYGGFIGVAIAALVAALLIKSVYYKYNNNYSVILRYVIPAMSLRWYLYSPTTLFRSCFINFGIIFFCFTILDKSIKRTK